MRKLRDTGKASRNNSCWPVGTRGVFLVWRVAGLVAAACYVSMANAERGLPGSRPILLRYVFSDTNEEVALQFDKVRRTPIKSAYYQRAPRWQPNSPSFAAIYDVGIFVSRYSPSNRTFTRAPLETLFPAVKQLGEQVVQELWPSLAWAPDGKSLVYESDRQLITVDLKRGKRRILVPVRLLGGDPRGNTFGVDWSPDRQWIAYSVRGRKRAPRGSYDTEWPSDEDVGTHCDIRLVRPDGTGRRRLGTGSRPRFSPDGSRLVALDRVDARFGTGIRLYDLSRRSATSRWVIEDAVAACFAGREDRLAVVLSSGDVVTTDMSGKVVRPILKFARALEVLWPSEWGGTDPGRVKRADIDW